MGAFGAGREFGGVGFGVLAALDAELACAPAWFAAIHSKAAGVVFFGSGGDVQAGHETVNPPAYEPTGVFWKPDLLFPFTFH